MLRDLLGRLAEGGFGTLEGLGRELGACSRELAQMLSKLEELGYIEDAARGFRAACTGCAGCSGCARSGACPDEATKVWVLTEKGRRAGRAPR